MNIDTAMDNMFWYFATVIIAFMSPWDVYIGNLIVSLSSGSWGMLFRFVVMWGMGDGEVHDDVILMRSMMIWCYYTSWCKVDEAVMMWSWWSLMMWAWDPWWCDVIMDDVSWCEVDEAVMMWDDVITSLWMVMGVWA